ncbi:hypothetical protein C8R43DRAFT_679093 [Mycena crocata]|nr:hypothetical protein C8R43DRAFT_679093 [Mycena crocata]
MSPATSTRIFILLILWASTTFLAFYVHAGLSLSSLSLNPEDARQAILPIPSRAYVISLQRRRDRYAEMERLRARLGLQWSYVAAEDSQSSLVGRIMSQVRSKRQEELKMKEYAPNTTIRLPFEWPSPEDGPSPPFGDPNSSFPAAADAEPLTCATEDFTLVPYSPRLKEYKILSRSRIACWHSHLSAIQRASAQRPEKASLILEDDVDMEADIKERLVAVWSLLPPDWDVVFLGHCWSNESHYPALGPPSSHLVTRLHPSHAPLCTHAYALSPQGAVRLLQHLTYPRFAYSRAIDHALAWLVQSGRLRSFSVVPSVVVQRKLGGSDVMAGTGSAWREQLVHGVLAHLFTDSAIPTPRPRRLSVLASVAPASRTPPL